MIIECACGAVIRGGSEQELLAAARMHIEAEHPELGGPPPDEDLLGMACEGESSDEGGLRNGPSEPARRTTREARLRSLEPSPMRKRKGLRHIMNARRIAAVRLTSGPVITAGALVLALTAGFAATGDAKSRGEPVKLTQVLFQTSSNGTPPASGSNSAVGTSDGRIAQTSIHGTVRGTNRYPAFTGKWIMFDSNGAIDFSLKGHVVAPGSFAGTAKITGGTGKYRRASGTLTFRAHTQTPTGGQSSPVIVRKLSGTLILP